MLFQQEEAIVKNTNRKIQGLGQVLKDIAERCTPPRKGEPDRRLNDGWSAQDEERSWQEYGDGGGCWWRGAS